MKKKKNSLERRKNQKKKSMKKLYTVSLALANLIIILINHFMK